MRLTRLALAALIATGCGGDDGDDTDTLPAQRSAPEQPADTTPGDTLFDGTDSTVVGVAGRPGQPGQADPSSPSGSADRRAGAAAARTTQRGQSGQQSQDSRLYTVQVAAFTEAASAAEWAGRLRQQGMPVWTSVAELNGQTFYRLRVGALSTVTDARRLGGMIAERYEWPVWVAPLTAADHPPEGAADASHRLIESG